MRRLTALPLALVLALGACASEPEAATPTATSSTATASPAELAPAAVDPDLAVQVTGAADAKPEVTITTPLSVEESTRKVVTAGTGAVIEQGQTVVLDYTLYNGRDGAELDTTYGKTAAAFPITDQLIRGVANGLLGATVGDRLAIAVAPSDGFGEQAGAAYAGLEATDTMVLVADLRDAYVPLTQAEGQAVTPPAGLPTVEVDAEGRPTGITIGADVDKNPQQLVVQPLITGTGAAVESGQTITVQYTGVRLEDGEQFDSSWESGQPASFPIGTGGVIAGWDQGLVGQPVGSRVLLVIPQALAYPDASEENGRPAGPLVFVVDILDAR
ncbi:FKBP-type peptidyl-prolyl cis-trans isomerase [Kineococcus glutinatus]|uniref:peptidylprolyl isomerase n=1 Tax=Kineococcus glutinatus TaxID=1070872 RepID=A0ABP9HYY0_9ACTN